MLHCIELADEFVHSICVQRAIEAAVIATFHSVDKVLVVSLVSLHLLEAGATASMRHFGFLVLDQMLVVLDCGIVVKSHPVLLKVMAEASLRLLDRFVFSQEFFLEPFKRRYLCLFGRSFILVGVKSFLHGWICGCLGSFSIFDHDMLMLLPVMPTDPAGFMSIEGIAWRYLLCAYNIRWHVFERARIMA